MCLNSLAGADQAALIANVIKYSGRTVVTDLSARCFHIPLNETVTCINEYRPFLLLYVKPVLILAIISAEHQIAAIGTKLYAGAHSLV